MEVISLEQAVEAGFEPLEYEIYRHFGKVRIRVDFLGDMGDSIPTLFYRDVSNGERVFTPINTPLPYAEKSAHELTRLVQLVQRNDLCLITLVHTNGKVSICDIVLFEREAPCTWRETCDQHSPCCAYKS
ncbi:hypothetical protein [Bilophila wadsworthia]|uniref:hypothetical protein n=1 Tax=Bilophila wadsworthia TaxID=35833 RepID=UPI00242B2CE7|nr:hypothetical protein [Bilophila wadsworthia]